MVSEQNLTDRLQNVDVVCDLTPIVGGVAQVFHDLLVHLRLLLVAEVEEGEEENRQEEGEEVERGINVKRKHSRGCPCRWSESEDKART